ncbi:hypothetical protein GCM10009069_11500 [Algimonas arctica]|uniref:Secreted protein n=1 Tax=Algimonas arctica TaxID=1479486 RepID=A0A8J3CRD5_9PROT|nr:hypothetical protein [Algimonas arctica]GHA90035.1 hypothetical protein GCM10009069_11500 [Algimonas arctica]
MKPSSLSHRLFLAPSLATLLLVTAAQAEDAPKPLSDEYCMPAGGIHDTIAKFDSIKPEKRDTVGPDLSLTFKLQENEIMPERVELRDADTVSPVQFNDKNRSIGFIDQLRAVSDAASLCIIDPARADRTREDRGFIVDINMGVRFKDTPGTHSLSQIEDGMKDGRSHYKKMVGAMGFMVPKFDYIAVAGEDDSAPPRVWATAEGVDLGEPDFELYDGARMVSIKALEKMGADGVRVEEGYYRMSPSPDAKTVAKFSGDD